MIVDINSSPVWYICSKPIDMRKGRDRLASHIREAMGTDPHNGRYAFIFYSKNYRTVKIYHYDFSGVEVYTKWFSNGRCLKPIFSTIAEKHQVTRSQLMLLLSGAVQSTLQIN